MVELGGLPPDWKEDPMSAVGKLNIKIRVRMTVEVVQESVWNIHCSLLQMRREAGELASGSLESLIKDSPAISIVGEADVVDMTVASDSCDGVTDKDVCRVLEEAVEKKL